ncbi:MAG: hypothetical protein EZS28_006415 [Streblomastix strix]|uniref:Uncharacterized protein n=1 Tax=Streblomastix strix TaxID=222440 RepID=A0A5J4WSD9_9EUKA|nr:MAG: hypothetical protein EZS28_006415 [Streblomastix strix]
MPTDFTDSQELLSNLQANILTINNAPFTQNNSIQINPTSTGYDDGLRIARTIENTGGASIELGCSRTSNTGAIEGQWSIFTPPNSSTNIPYSFVIAVSSQVSDNTRGLEISADGQTLKFNGNGLVDVGSDQTINGIKTFGKLLQINPTLNGQLNECIEISRHSDNLWCIIQFCSDPNLNSEYIANQRLIGTIGNIDSNPFGFTIVKAGQEGQIDRGLQISPYGNKLTFNGRVF